MNESIDLKALERKVYFSYHQDGLVDICIGIPIILFGLLFHPLIAEYVPAVAMSQLIWWVFIYAALKRAITIPRLGYVEFASERRSRFWLLVMVLVLITNVPLIIMVLLTAGQQIAPQVSIFLAMYFQIIIGLFGASIFVLLGFLSELRRFFGYGIVTFSFFIVSHFLFLHFSYSIIGLGIVITVTGFFQLFWFLRKYQKDTEKRVVGESWEEE